MGFGFLSKLANTSSDSIFNDTGLSLNSSSLTVVFNVSSSSVHSQSAPNNPITLISDNCNESTYTPRIIFKSHLNWDSILAVILPIASTGKLPLEITAIIASVGLKSDTFKMLISSLIVSVSKSITDVKTLLSNVLISLISILTTPVVDDINLIASIIPVSISCFFSLKPNSSSIICTSEISNLIIY